MNFSIELNNCNLETIAVKMPGLNSKDEEQKDIGRCE